MNFTV
jgi:hypothetical protein